MGKFYTVQDPLTASLVLGDLAKRCKCAPLWDKRGWSHDWSSQPISCSIVLELNDGTGVVRRVDQAGDVVEHWVAFLSRVRDCWRGKLLDGVRLRASMDDAWYEEPWTSLDVEEVVQVVKEWVLDWCDWHIRDSYDGDDLRARLAAKLNELNTQTNG